MPSSFAGHSVSYNNSVIELKVLYFHPRTRTHHKITVSYIYNNDVAAAIENHLLRSPHYASWNEKKKGSCAGLNEIEEQKSKVRRNSRLL